MLEGLDEWDDFGASAYDVKMAQYAASVPTAKMDAAISSRSFLSSNVEILPFPVSDNIVVRSFGRVKVEGEETSGKKKKKSSKAAGSTPTKEAKKDAGGDEALFSSAASIHPVGFSCDRFEFSPIHGRMVRLRCDILDGAKVRNLRIAQEEAVTKAKRAAKAKKTREENKRKKEEAEAAAVVAAAAAKPENGTDGSAAAAVQADDAPSSATDPTAQPPTAATEPAQGGDSGPVASCVTTAVPAPAPAPAFSASASAPADTTNAVADTKPDPEPKPSKKVKEEVTNGEEAKDDGTEEAPLLTLENDDYEGPIFRVMWGAGIEQNPENDYSYPYDVYSASAPLTDDAVDAVAVPLDASGHVLGRSMVPEVGMRVSVRFDETTWYGGTITKIKDGKKGGKKLPPGQRLLSIDYDDGNKEEAVYPDPDILLRPPGTFLPTPLCFLLGYTPLHISWLTSYFSLKNTLQSSQELKSKASKLVMSK